MGAVVVNLKHNPRFDVYCGRATSCPAGFTGPGADGYFGNPYAQLSRVENIALFKKKFHERIVADVAYYRAVESLRGKVLGCWCSPMPCHCDVYVHYLERVR